ncbi:MAG: nucleoside monophosphate kinase [Candidatus Shapirobacteria bacterium]
MSLNLFIIGPSGCGKSTQAKLIAEKYSLTHMSMGQLLRNEIASKSSLGLEAQSYIDVGKWVPDELAFRVLTASLQKINNSNFILDGFPRMIGQGIMIEDHLKNLSLPFSLIIHLDVTFEEILARRQKKGDAFQNKDRTDNTPAAIAARQKSYEETIGPIIDHYEPTQKLFRVDGNRPVEPIFTDIQNRIDLINQSSP